VREGGGTVYGRRILNPDEEEKQPEEKQESPGPWAWVAQFDPEREEFWKSQWDPRTLHVPHADDEDLE
jgi:hypothetical protein